MNKMWNNYLIVIENGDLKSFCLDDKNKWMVGRPSKDNVPDIKLHSPMVSRKHGFFENEMGKWFYTDTSGGNGTIYNGKHITKGIGGRRKPKMLKDGDVFIFGSEEPHVNLKTVLGMFSEKGYDGRWRVEDTSGLDRLTFSNGKTAEVYEKPAMGTVIKFSDGEAIYMGDLTYMIGNIFLSL